MVDLERLLSKEHGVDTIALPDLVRYQDLSMLGITRHRFDRLLNVGPTNASGLPPVGEACPDYVASLL